jgi:phosphopantothenoylcysteine decarboxylase/phosphopantothenate--cysteine ligase
MERAALENFSDTTLVIAAAAVSDFYPRDKSGQKIKKQGAPLSIELCQSPDILKKMGEEKRPSQVLVGFALETDNLIENARRKLEEKRLDMVVANGPAAMESKTNQVSIITAGIDGGGTGGVEEFSEASKDDVANRILDRTQRLRALRPLSL